MALDPQPTITRTATRLQSVKATVESFYDEDGVIQEIMDYEIRIDDEDEQLMNWNRGELSEHLEQKEFDDFIKAIDKFRKKAEREILP